MSLQAWHAADRAESFHCQALQKRICSFRIPPPPDKFTLQVIEYSILYVFFPGPRIFVFSPFDSKHVSGCNTIAKNAYVCVCIYKTNLYLEEVYVCIKVEFITFPRVLIKTM
jgi:hypothetical protein